MPLFPPGQTSRNESNRIESNLIDQPIDAGGLFAPRAPHRFQGGAAGEAHHRFVLPHHQAAQPHARQVTGAGRVSLYDGVDPWLLRLLLYWQNETKTRVRAESIWPLASLLVIAVSSATDSLVAVVVVSNGIVAFACPSLKYPYPCLGRTCPFYPARLVVENDPLRYLK